jgi:hypothetical protein
MNSNTAAAENPSVKNGSAAKPVRSTMKPVPEGLHTVTPHLVCAGAAEAIEFYKRAFNATEMIRLPGAEGKLMHASIRIGDSMVMLVDEFPSCGSCGPKMLNGSPVTLHLAVDDVDAVIAQGRQSRGEDYDATPGHVLGRPLRQDRGSLWASMVRRHPHPRSDAGGSPKSRARGRLSLRSVAADRRIVFRMGRVRQPYRLRCGQPAAHE